MRTHNIHVPSCYIKSKRFLICPLTWCYYQPSLVRTTPCLELIFMVPKAFERLKFDYIRRNTVNSQYSELTYLQVLSWTKEYLVEHIYYFYLHFKSCYLKLLISQSNFLAPENLLWDISSLGQTLTLKYWIWQLCEVGHYSRLSLSRNWRDHHKHFEISVLRHIRFVILRKKQYEQPHFTNDYVIWLL